MPSSPSLLKRALEPLASALWSFFIAATLAVGAVWIFALNDAQVAKWVGNQDLARALYWLLQRLDLLWIGLAAANSYLCLTRREGLNTARQWGILIFLSVVTLGWISVRTGYPLGLIQFGQTLGTRLGPVPVGLPLFWFSVIIGAREALLRFFPRWNHGQIALGGGLLVAVTDASLEPLAAKLRGFWFWRANVPTDPPIFDFPVTSILVWGLAGGLLTYVLREKSVVASTRPRSWQPAVTLLIFHAIFLGAHVARWLRG